MKTARRLETWARQLYDSYAPAIATLIGADQIPDVRIRAARAGSPGWTNGANVGFSASWFAEHPDDVGCCLHEFTHAIMQAPVYESTTAWLTEGIADYVHDSLGFDAS